MTASTTSGDGGNADEAAQRPAPADGSAAGRTGARPYGSPAARPEKPSIRALVEQATRPSIASLQARYLKDDPAAVAKIARLRRGAGKRAHELQELWGIDALDKLAELMEELAEPPHQEDAESAEEAVFLASTLWALHQQSRREDKMHADGRHLGGAVRALIQRSATSGADEERSPLRTRLVRVGTAESLDSVAVRLREIVLLLRTASEPLDYARLAGQLYRWQNRRDRPGVQREWGREFHLAAVPPAKRRKAVDSGTGAGDAIDRRLSADEEGAYGGYAAGE
ncbi:type I-E CRISPR-associated protein Cse2/CasB [Streptomyces sp. NPDC014622]|uniref:type I-E CRISPR-associated protein Cse2/CasB n=1 Tax=Streptomyces sp. NPDC014622 TaxID=3364874 RepID=UPI0036FB78DE